MTKKPNDNHTPEATECARLQRENDALSQQVKRLIKAESRLYDYQEKLDAQLKEYKELYQLSRKINASLDIRKVFEFTSEYIIYNLGYERVVFFELHEDSGRYTVCTLEGYYDQQEKDVVAELTIHEKDNVLSPLQEGEDYLICKADSCREGVVEYRSKLLMDEYLIYPLCAHNRPHALLAVGNSAGNAEFYRRVGEGEGALLGIGNLVELLISAVENQIFHKELEKRVAERTDELEKIRMELEMQNEELQRTYQELETETADRIRAMERLREKEQMMIQQNRLAAMGEMLGNIAHQWRQPLNVLGLKIQELGLSCEFGEFSKELLDANIGKAMEIVCHLSQTIDDFRNFATPDREKSLFSLNQVIARTISLVEESFREKHINVEVRTTGDPLVSGYPNEYSQVLLNILMNARDAFLEQGIGEGRITVRSCTENDRSVVTITDNAGGINEEIMDYIFDAYFTTKSLGKGTGIGLFMSKKIIESNMGGRLSARNVADGAEFRIEI
jgi:signal transduction histidine kinase